MGCKFQQLVRHGAGQIDDGEIDNFEYEYDEEPTEDDRSSIDGEGEGFGDSASKEYEGSDSDEDYGENTGSSSVGGENDPSGSECTFDSVILWT